MGADALWRRAAAAWAFLWVAWSAQAQESLPALVKRLEPSVVLVQTYASGGRRLSQGTAFFVGNEGDVVTSRHVLVGAERAQVRAPDGKSYPVRAVVAEDRTRDLVRLALEIPPEAAKPLPLAQALPEPGETVVVIGSPLGLEQTVTDGIVSAIRKISPLGQVIQMSAPISPGSSGSPVVDMRGQVVGVASFRRQDGQNLNFAIPAKALADMARGPERPLATLLDRPRTMGPSPAEDAYLQGVALLAQKNYTRALPAFEEAVKARPSYADAYMHIGACLEGLGRKAEAVEAYRSAALLEPEVTDFQTRLACALEGQGHEDEAAEAFAQAVRLSPENVEALLGLARVLVKAGRLEMAIGSCQQAARIQPGSREVFEMLGSLYLRLGRTTQAAEAYRQAVRLDPAAATAHCGMGEAFLRMDRYREASEAFTEAVRLAPDDAAAHYGLGRTALAAGNRGLALEEYRVLKRLDPIRGAELFSAIY